MRKARAKQEPVRCCVCNEPLIDFMAYIPGKGESCLKCFAEFAQKEDNLLITRSKEKKLTKLHESGIPSI
jgi:hypothetical protein